jgi:hypothetical protein
VQKEISIDPVGKDRIYADFPSHPSDEARMRAIFYMLSQMGFNKEVKDVDTLWQAFLTNVNNPIPFNYAYIFPQQLIEALGQSVLKGCQKIDLWSYLDQIKKFNPPISKILNDAWAKVLSDSAGYKVWEEERINDIGGLL